MNTKNTITYRQEGDYLLPNLVPPESPRIGVWGIRRRDFLKKHRDSIYTGLLLKGKLNAHLEEIDKTANEMFDLLIRQYSAWEGVTEQLKSENQLEWVRRMNSIRGRVEEVIYRELIYAEMRDVVKPINPPPSSSTAAGLESGGMKKPLIYDYDQLPVALNALQVAAMLGISRAGAYNLMRSEGFPTLRIGSRMVVPKDKLLAWLDKQFSV